jgi:8-oxo-dGTP diphosphatase
MTEPTRARKPATHVVEVSAGVLLRNAQNGVEYLLAQRPPDKVYAGYWEFPGGKVEPGETFRAALVRELAEELGIAVTYATPWLYRQFAYPHAQVRLKFFRVTGWRGEIGGLEHTALAWTRVGEAPAAAPILPANGPVLRALAVPETYAITHAAENGVDAELERIRQGLARGVRLFQLRDKTLTASERRRFAERTAAIVATTPGALLLVGDDDALAREIGAHGVHLSSARLGAASRRPGFAWVAASCHGPDDLERVESLGIDFAVLGPVLPTPSHPESPGIGWNVFAQWVARAPIPVFALGGLHTESIAAARKHGAHGIAMLRGW